MSGDWAAARLKLGLVFALLLALYAAGNALWLKQNGIRCVGLPFHTRHFMKAVEQYECLKGGMPFLDFIRVLRKDRFHPAPLHSFTAALGFLALGKDLPLVTGLLNLPYFALALLALIGIAKELGHPPEVALWAMALYALYPAVYGLSRLYGAFDFQTAATVPAAVWCLLKTRGFDSRRYSLLLAAAAAFGLLIKDTFAGYFGPVLVFAAFSALRPFETRRALNLLLMLAATAAAVSFYYASPAILYKEATEPFRESVGPWILFHNWRTYTLGLSENLLSAPFFLLFMGSLAGLLRRKPRGFQEGLLLSWILVPWALIFFMPHAKQLSYFVPILPAAALLSASALCAFPPRWRRIAMPALVVLGMVQYASFSFGVLDKLRDIPLGTLSCRLPAEPPRPHFGQDLRFWGYVWPYRYRATYFKLDPGILYHKDFPTEFDLYQRTAEKILSLGGRGEKILVLQAYATHEAHQFYYALGWIHDLDFRSTGGYGDIFRGEFLRGSYDKVLYPVREGWSVKQYAANLYWESMMVVQGHWLDDTFKAIKDVRPERFAVELDRFLARYPAREKLGSDGENELWLLSKAPPKRR